MNEFSFGATANFYWYLGFKACYRRLVPSPKMARSEANEFSFFFRWCFSLYISRFEDITRPLPIIRRADEMDGCGWSR